MDKETLSHYGWIVILVLILAVLLALASPFGNFIAGAFKATYAGFSMVGDNALGIIIPGTEQDTSPTIKFYQPYRGTISGMNVEYIFHEDGSCDLYLLDLKQGMTVSSGTVEYGDGFVNLNGQMGTITAGGKELIFEGANGGEDMSLTLIPTPIHYLYYGSFYASDATGENTFAMKFNQEGSGQVTNNGVTNDFPKGYITYLERYFKPTDAEDENKCAVYPNGTKILVDGVILEIECLHTNTEVRNMSDTYTGDKYCTDCGKLLLSGTEVIPTGGIYTTVDGEVYEAGDEWPEIVQNGDKYTYMDYEYRYNTSKFTMYGEDAWSGIFDNSQNGWGVDTIVNNKTSYGPILKSINGKPITSLVCTFRNCTFMSAAPEIPNTVVNLEGAFAYSGIVVAPSIPESVINMCCTFQSCTNLTEGTTIPSSVTNIKNTFSMCEKLTGTIIINATPTNWNTTNNNYSGCFANTSLPIELSGTSPALNKIANSFTNGNVTVK